MGLRLTAKLGRSVLRPDKERAVARLRRRALQVLQWVHDKSGRSWRDNPAISRNLLLTSHADLGIKDEAAVAATRGDLGQLAPRKKLLKSW